MPQNFPTSLRSFVRCHHLPSPRLAWGLAAGLFLAIGTASAVVSPSAGDSLQWDGASDPSWTSSNKVWYDTNLLTTVSLGDSSGSQGLAYSYIFNGSGTNATVAPTTMTIGDDSSANSPVLGVNALTYNNGFNATNTMAVSSGRDNGIAESLALASGWSITDNATSGSVTFNTTQFSSVLYFTMTGAGTIATPNANASVVINSSLTGSGASITKTGNGILALAGTQSSYSGGTTVSGGTLLIAGGSTVSSVTGTGALTVNTGATLAGNGFAFSNTTINSGATLSPGTGTNGIGTLALGTSGTGSGLTINGTLRVDIAGGGTTAGVNYDQVSVAGLTMLNPTSSNLVIGSVNPAGLAIGQTFYLLLNGGTNAVIGTFNGLLPGATVTDPAGDTYTISYTANGDGGTLGNDVALTVASVVPEPSAAVGCVLGAAGLLAGYRRRRR